MDSNSLILTSYKRSPRQSPPQTHHCKTPCSGSSLQWLAPEYAPGTGVFQAPVILFHQLALLSGYEVLTPALWDISPAHLTKHTLPGYLGSANQVSRQETGTVRYSNSSCR